MCFPIKKENTWWTTNVLTIFLWMDLYAILMHLYNRTSKFSCLVHKLIVKFCLIFRLFLGQWRSFKKDCFWDLLTFKIDCAPGSTRAFYSGRYFNYDKKLHSANNICVATLCIWWSYGIQAFKMGCFSYKRTLMKLSWNPRITNCPHKSVQGNE